jgi:hypothetical protein
MGECEGDCNVKVIRREDNPLFTIIHVLPWPDEPLWPAIAVHFQKRDSATGQQPVNRATVRYGLDAVDIQTAREYARAILRACDIAERLEQDGVIVLEGEGNNKS